MPISVTALTQDDMDERGIKDFQDIARFTPGVSIDNSGTNAISIRGISSSGGAGTTGIYIDDTPIQMRTLGFNPDDTLPKTFDLDRVEILRGPQGTLFGAGSEGGTVRYIITQPSYHYQHLCAQRGFLHPVRPAELRVRRRPRRPIIDGTLGFRASAWYRSDGGWIDRVDPAPPPRRRHHNVNYYNSLLRLRRSGSRSSSHRHAEHHVSAAGSTTSRPTGPPTPILGRPVQHGDAGAHSGPDKYYLPALKLEYDLDKSAIISNCVLLPPQ